MPTVVDPCENCTCSILHITLQVRVLVSKAFTCIAATLLPGTKVAISKQIWPAQVLLAMQLQSSAFCFTSRDAPELEQFLQE